MDEGVLEFEFEVMAAGERLDRLVLDQLSAAGHGGLSRVQVQALIKEGQVQVNGAPVKAGVKLRGGERVRVTVPPDPDETIEAEDLPLTVVYEDEDVAVIDKPAGMVVHPGAGNTTGTLAHALLARYPEVAQMDTEAGRQGIVHRLDKGTSGLMVVARHQAALDDLMAQFQERAVDKMYLALLERTPKTLTGRIEAPIGRDPKQRKRMAVLREGRDAITEYKVIDDNFQDQRALVEFYLFTGRTHQIRVHAAFIGCPVVGDTVYGYRKQRLKLKRQFLHAAKLAFDHPASGERLSFESDLPVGLVNILQKLRP